MRRPSRHAVTGLVAVGTCLIVLLAGMIWIMLSLHHGLSSVPW
ncbi:hypothetical protein [Streptacidiphilus rugosus]|nr:hypothetical protein [Streptacidiphilus rugosus]